VRTNIFANASVRSKLNHAVWRRETAPDRRPGDRADQIREGARAGIHDSTKERRGAQLTETVANAFLRRRAGSLPPSPLRPCAAGLRRSACARIGGGGSDDATRGSVAAVRCGPSGWPEAGWDKIEERSRGPRPSRPASGARWSHSLVR
jgi:hypothetical protein